MRKIKLSIFLFGVICFLLHNTNILAQTRTLTGSVYNGITSKPISATTVEVKGVKEKALTTSEGEYSLIIPDSVKNISFENFEGYEIMEIKQISEDETNIYLSQVNISLSIEDLMKVKVITASKKLENQQSAPEVITVLTQKEIEGFGSLTFKEILDRMVSTFANGTYSSPNGMLSMRGTQTGNYNTNILILLDGRPMRSSLEGGFQEVIYDMFPVNQIEKIELVRGTGSVLYGSNAYLGVINIITKTGKENSTKIMTSYGSFETKQAQFSFNRKVKNVDIAIGVTSVYNKGWEFTARGENDVIRNKTNTSDSLFKSPTTIHRDLQGVGGTVKIAYKGFLFNTFVAHTDLAMMGPIPNWPSPPLPLELRQTSKRMVTDLGYKTNIIKNWSVGANATFNNHHYTLYAPDLPGPSQEYWANDVLLEASSNLTVNSKLNITGGILTNIQSGRGHFYSNTSNGKTFNLTQSANLNPWVGVPEYKDNWYSTYFQTDYNPASFVKIIAGTQANKVSNVDWDFVPRLGVIFVIHTNFAAKILLGQAFRSSTGFERSSRFPNSVYGNPLLLPEKITTYSLQLSYTTKQVELQLTFFQNKDNQKIIRVQAADTLIVDGNKVAFSQKYINSGYITSQGIELEGKYYLNLKWAFTGSLATQSSEDNKGLKDNGGMPMFMAKGGILYDDGEFLRVGLFNSYFGNSGDINRYTENNVKLTKMANPESKPFNDMSLNINIRVGKFSNRLKNIAFNCYISNLLNEEIYYKEIVRRNINSLPGRGSRATNFGFSLKF